MAHATITPEVEAVLRNSTITADSVKLPPGQLERKLYEAVNKALVNAGGKWNRSKGVHVFSSDPREKLLGGLETGIVRDEKKDRQAFYTPPELAARVAEIADVEGRTVLEPSAGKGALAIACRDAGALRVGCYDIDAPSVHALEALGFSAVCTDFLTCTPVHKYERVVMNPPFTRNQDVRHVRHALKFLGTGGVLVAIMANNQARRPFEDLVSTLDHEIEEVPAGAFKESGTSVATLILKVRT